jgi:hypothetical protein
MLLALHGATVDGIIVLCGSTPFLMQASQYGRVTVSFLSSSAVPVDKDRISYDV